MSSAVKHAKRSHRSDGRTRAAFGNMSRKAYIRSSDSYSGKGLALQLTMFGGWIRNRRESAKAGTEGKNAG